MATVSPDGLGPLEVATAFLRTVVCAGASRHVASSVAATLFRLVSEGPECGGTEGELQDRLSCIRPVLAAKLNGENASGTQSARRNLASHDMGLRQISKLDSQAAKNCCVCGGGQPIGN